MPSLPPSHTAAADPRASALEIASTIIIGLWNLQHIRPQLKGTRDMIENLPVGLQRRWDNRGV